MNALDPVGQRTVAMNWLASTIGKRGYIADYLRAASGPGSRIVGTGNDRHTVGFLACDSISLLGSIDDERYIEDVLALCEREAIDAIVTLSDLDVLALARHRDTFVARGIACFFPALSAAEAFGDKWLTFRLMRAAGLPVPDSWIDVEAVPDPTDVRPLIVKPRFGSASKGVEVVSGAVALAKAFRSTDRPIVQRLVPGRHVNVEVCSDVDGVPLAACAWERVVSIMGETGLATTIEHPEAIELVLRILQSCPVPGPVDVDLIESADGLHLIEVNTRFGGGYPTSHLAGADFPGVMIRSLDGLRPASLDEYERGVTMMKVLTPVRYAFPMLQ